MDYVKVENISKIYPIGQEAVTALSNISFKMSKGEFAAVTGPSGCGKSTLLHIIGGLNKPTYGNVFICGKPLYQKNKSQLALYRRRQAGIIYQFYNLVPELTAEENLILPALMDHKKVSEKKLNDILEILGMTEKRNFYPRQLSGGQQQKIAIGRALVYHPSLLLADEPTGNLDSANRNEILKLFCYLNKQESVTILMVTHDQEAAKAADRNIHMIDGSIVRDEVRI